MVGIGARASSALLGPDCARGSWLDRVRAAPAGT